MLPFSSAGRRKGFADERYLTPVASDGFRSTLKPENFKDAKKKGNLIFQN